MTKIEALVQLIVDNGGKADWETIYNQIEQYYPNAKQSLRWQEGLRGVLYRGIKQKHLIKLDVGFFAVPEYTAPVTNSEMQVEQCIYPEIDDISNYYEGAKSTITINKFERNSIARQKCIEIHGCYCHICGMNFEDVYGEIGKDFIHVHHIIPLNEIDEKYVVNPETDLIPVCPNCHAMAHRKINGVYVNLEKLKNIFIK